MGGDLAVRGGAGADLLAIRHCAGDWSGSARHGLGASAQCSLSGVQTSDGWIAVGGANQTNWLRLLQALGAPELAEDPRFRSGADRMAHVKELEADLTRRFRQKPAYFWLDALEDRGVPCGPVNDMLQALADPQTLARDMVVEVAHSSLGAVKTIGLPVNFSATPGKVRKGAPRYGEHTREVLREYGFDDGEIERFIGEGAIVAPADDGARQRVA